MYPNQVVRNGPCYFTCCFCCQCSYDALCVIRAAYALDFILFGLWVIQAISYVGSAFIGGYGYIYLAISIVLLGMAVYAAVNLCTLTSSIQNGTLRAKNQKYMKIRMYFTIFLIVSGIIIFLVWFFLVRDYVKSIKNYDGSRTYTDDEAFAVSLNAALSVLIPFIVDVIILYGYKQSFEDAVRVICGEAPANYPGQFAPPPVYYQGTAPQPIGGNGPNPYAQGREMGYVPPPPLAQGPGQSPQTYNPPNFIDPNRDSAKA